MCDYCVRAVIGNALVIWPIGFVTKYCSPPLLPPPIFKRQGNQALFSITRQAFHIYRLTPSLFSHLCLLENFIYAGSWAPGDIGVCKSCDRDQIEVYFYFSLMKGVCL